MSESNFRCTCGEPLYFHDNGTRHRIYTCLNCSEVYAVKGDDHYMIISEIDTATGKIIPMEETEKGKKFVVEEEKRLNELYPNYASNNRQVKPEDSLTIKHSVVLEHKTEDGGSTPPPRIKEEK